MLFLKQPLNLPFLRHKSATTCQIDSSKVSNSQLKLEQCNCVKAEIIESINSPQYPHKWGTNALETLYKTRVPPGGCKANIPDVFADC